MSKRSLAPAADLSNTQAPEPACNRRPRRRFIVALGVALAGLVCPEVAHADLSQLPNVNAMIPFGSLSTSKTTLGNFKLGWIFNADGSVSYSAGYVASTGGFDDAAKQAYLLRLGQDHEIIQDSVSYAGYA